MTMTNVQLVWLGGLTLAALLCGVSLLAGAVAMFRRDHDSMCEGSFGEDPVFRKERLQSEGREREEGLGGDERAS
jgi:hypothetical protein